MDELVQLDAPGLPTLIERASAALAAAKTSAEVLEAKDLATAAHDAATALHRLARAKQAQDEVLETIRQAQRDALLIECAAMPLFADEYDEALERGEVRGRGRPAKNVPGENIIPTATDLGVTRKDILQARRVRDFEKAQTGGVERALDEMVAEGVEPTRARLRRLLKPATGGARRQRGEPRPAHDAGPAGLLRLLETIAEIDVPERVAGLKQEAELADLLPAVEQAQANLERLSAELKDKRFADPLYDSDAYVSGDVQGMSSSIRLRG